jgi:hypothetical protein
MDEILIVFAFWSSRPATFTFLARKIPSASSLDLFQEIGNVMVVFSKVRDYTGRAAWARTRRCGSQMDLAPLA